MTSYSIVEGTPSNGLTLQSLDSAIVFDGGVATNTTVEAGGQLFLESGGTAVGALILFDGSEDVTGQDFDADLNGGFQLVWGLATGTTLMDGALQYIEESGVVQNATLSGGSTQNVTGGASYTVVDGDSVQWVLGIGETEFSTIGAGSAELVYAGTAANTTVESGGYLVAMPGSTISNPDVLPGGQEISSGVIIVDAGQPLYYASSTSFGEFAGSAAAVYVLSGGDAEGFTFSQSSAVVFAGGTLGGSTVASFSNIAIDAGGLSESNQFEAGIIQIGSSAVSMHDTVSGGATFEVGGAASDDVILAGGSLVGGDDASQGVISNITLAGGYASLFILEGTALLEDGSTLLVAGDTGGVVNFSGVDATLVLNDPSPQNTDFESLNVTGFSDSDTIFLDTSPESVSFVSGLGLVFTNGYATNTLSLSGQFAASDVTFTSVKGGVEVTLCFLRGSKILTPEGEVAVEELRAGMKVITRFGGVRPVQWIGEQHYAPQFVAGNHEKWPVRIEPGALDGCLPVRDLYISPGHSVMLGGQLVLARDLVNGINITQENSVEIISYFGIDLGVHDCVLANGAWAESFADGPGLRSQFHNYAAFRTLRPNYFAPPALQLCVPRPEAGSALEALLRPVRAAAAAKICPGELRGFVDRISADGLIEGWAQDEANPELAVALEICLGGTVLGETLAYRYRDDLAAAGIGKGRAMFSFLVPGGLSAAMRRRIQVRRAEDGKLLPVSAVCEAMRQAA